MSVCPKHLKIKNKLNSLSPLTSFLTQFISSLHVCFFPLSSHFGDNSYMFDARGFRAGLARLYLKNTVPRNHLIHKRPHTRNPALLLPTYLHPNAFVQTLTVFQPLRALNWLLHVDLGTNLKLTISFLLRNTSCISITHKYI